MSKKLLALSLLTIIANNCYGFDYDKIYYQIHGGWAKLNKASHNHNILYTNMNAAMVGAAWGYDVSSVLRTQIDAEYRFNQKLSAESVDEAHALDYRVYTGTLAWTNCIDMANFYNVIPYIGFGIGVARISGKAKFIRGDFTTDGSANRIKPSINFHWKMLAGFAYKVRDDLYFSIDYGYKSFGKLKKTPRANLTGIEVAFAIRTRF